MSGVVHRDDHDEGECFICVDRTRQEHSHVRVEFEGTDISEFLTLNPTPIARLVEAFNQTANVLEGTLEAIEQPRGRPADPADIPNPTDYDRRRWARQLNTEPYETSNAGRGLTIDELLGTIDETLDEYKEQK